jgi:hypothetical protein
VKVDIYVEQQKNDSKLRALDFSSTASGKLCHNYNWRLFLVLTTPHIHIYDLLIITAIDTRVLQR